MSTKYGRTYMSVNGKLFEPPTIIVSASGVKVANFELEVIEWDKNTKQDTFSYVPVTVFAALADIVESRCNVGEKYTVDGRIVAERYTDKNGVERSGIKLIGNKIV